MHKEYEKAWLGFELAYYVVTIQYIIHHVILQLSLFWTIYIYIYVYTVANVLDVGIVIIIIIIYIYIYIYVYIYIYIYILDFIYLVDKRNQGRPRAPFSIATTPRCRGGPYPFPPITPIYPWYIPYNAEC